MPEHSYPDTITEHILPSLLYTTGMFGLGLLMFQYNFKLLTAWMYFTAVVWGYFGERDSYRLSVAESVVNAMSRSGYQPKEDPGKPPKGRNGV